MGPFMMRFQIKDLEEFSGVKAHTIRMWEKRYGLLSPARTDTNIRTYGIEDLKAILNVAFLNQHGIKISKIAALPSTERDRMVREVALSGNVGADLLASLKMAMLSFDEILFESVSSKFREVNGFRALVEKLYVPLLENIGLLWQTNSICPAHEHFVSNIIRQKLIAAVDALPLSGSPKGKVHVLYLPENELHELGLLYVNYLIRAKGYRTIYLGQGVPLEDLRQVGCIVRGDIVFIGILTSLPGSSDVQGILKELGNGLPEDRFSFMLAFNQFDRSLPSPARMRLYSSMLELVAAIDQE